MTRPCLALDPPPPRSPCHWFLSPAADCWLASSADNPLHDSRHDSRHDSLHDSLHASLHDSLHDSPMTRPCLALDPPPPRSPCHWFLSPAADCRLHSGPDANADHPLLRLCRPAHPKVLHEPATRGPHRAPRHALQALAVLPLPRQVHRGDGNGRRQTPPTAHDCDSGADHRPDTGQLSTDHIRR